MKKEFITMAFLQPETVTNKLYKANGEDITVLHEFECKDVTHKELNIQFAAFLEKIVESINIKSISTYKNFVFYTFYGEKIIYKGNLRNLVECYGVGKNSINFKRFTVTLLQSISENITDKKQLEKIAAFNEVDTNNTKNKSVDELHISIQHGSKLINDTLKQVVKIALKGTKSELLSNKISIAKRIERLQTKHDSEVNANERKKITLKIDNLNKQLSEINTTIESKKIQLLY